MNRSAPRLVSELPTRVDPSVLGQQLASPARRLGALVFDISLVLIPSVAVAFGAAIFALWLSNPEALRTIGAEARHVPEADQTARMARLGKLAPLLVSAEAEGLPPAVAVAVQEGDPIA